MEKVRYLLDEFPGATFDNSPVEGHRGNDVTGYGRKIRTDYTARFNSRTHRVYVCCYSNSGSAYVLHLGSWLHVRDHDIPS